MSGDLVGEHIFRCCHFKSVLVFPLTVSLYPSVTVSLGKSCRHSPNLPLPSPSLPPPSSNASSPSSFPSSTRGQKKSGLIFLCASGEWFPLFLFPCSAALRQVRGKGRERGRGEGGKVEEMEPGRL